jgi:hypothetical protein
VKAKQTVDRIITLLTAAAAPEYRIAPYRERSMALKREMSAG